MSRQTVLHKSRLINLRVDEEFLNQLEIIRRYYRKEMALEMTVSQILRTCVNRVCDSIQNVKPLI